MKLRNNARTPCQYCPAVECSELSISRDWDRSEQSAPQSDGRYAKFRNDNGVNEIRIGVREFECIGVTPPHDHPHVYLNMGEMDTIICPYCATRFRFDVRLTRFDADPPDCIFAEPSGTHGDTFSVAS